PQVGGDVGTGRPGTPVGPARRDAGVEEVSDPQGPGEVRRPVFAAERRQRILELLRANGALSLRELAQAVRSSEVTVRRDLKALAAEGLLNRHHGGATLPGDLTREPTHAQKAQ